MDNINQAIQAVKTGDYNTFKSAIKSELNNRIANNPKIQQMKSDYDKLQQTLDAFKAINQNLSPDTD